MFLCLAVVYSCNYPLYYCPHYKIPTFLLEYQYFVKIIFVSCYFPYNENYF